MNITDLLLANPGRPANWRLLRPCSHQLLPCRVPFDGAQLDLSSAIQGYAIGSLGDARRYVELRRLTKSWDNPCHWPLRLVECMLLLEQNQAEDAWHQLQAGLAWRNAHGKESVMRDALPSIAVPEWLIMATVALAVGKPDVAEAHASEAIARIQSQSTFSVGEILQDTRGDAMTVFASIKLYQQHFREAEMLLELAHDAHVQAGDMEQIVVDLILMADVELNSGNTEAMTYLLYQAETILTDECDPSRHHRIVSFRHVVHQRLLAAQKEKWKPRGNTCLN